jgi:hypothetical protein
MHDERDRIRGRLALGAAGLALLLVLAGCGDLSLLQALKGDSPGDFQLSPDSLNLPVSSEYSFTAMGGIGPYSFDYSGKGTLDRTIWKYKAPATVSDPQGWDQVLITATDLMGNIDTAVVRVYETFALSGGASVVLNEADPAHDFSATGGVGPYRWLLTRGVQDEQEVASGITAWSFDPAVEGVGSFLVGVRDSIGNYRQASVTVAAPSGGPLTIDPAGATVEKSTSVIFTAFGGDGVDSYSWQTTGGSLVVSADTVTAQHTVPDSAQELTVTLSSGAWPAVTVRVVVTDSAPLPPPALVLLPDAPVVNAVKHTVQFTLTGGTPPYLFYLKNQYKNWATITADGLYTHEKSGKNVVVTVEDSGAPVQSASTTVYWQN